MRQRDSKIIGYFAYTSPGNAVCTDVDACVIAGSARAMEDHLSNDPEMGGERVVVKKTRFGEILQGLHAGAAYGFDEEAYARFLPLAREEGIPVAEWDVEGQRTSGGKFFTVRPVSR